MSWFIQWENSVKSNEKIRNKEKCLISHQTRQDIISAILGFEELCTYKLKKSNASIIPYRVNSDGIENIFCQQRTMHNGANANPTYLGYCHTIHELCNSWTGFSFQKVKHWWCSRCLLTRDV